MKKSRVLLESYMRHALGIAKRGQGVCSPNPSVGCVLVKNDMVIGRGTTARGGRPHAEVVALKQACERFGVDALRGATSYVTLEPCAHIGKTPPCALALVEAGITRVVIGTLDPDERVSGRGVQMLKDAGLEVVVGVLQSEAQAVHLGFLRRITHKRPAITLKIATSADGKIARGIGERTAITSADANTHVHLMRSYHDAIVVGVNTVLTDNPILTTRLSGFKHDTLRVVLDSRLRTAEKPSLNIISDGNPALIMHSVKSERDIGSKFQYISSDENGLHLREVMRRLAEQGINRVLVEGGASVLTSFLTAELWDDFYWYRSPDIFGAQGVSALVGIDILDMPNEFSMKHQLTRILERDTLDIYCKYA